MIPILKENKPESSTKIFFIYISPPTNPFLPTSSSSFSLWHSYCSAGCFPRIGEDFLRIISREKGKKKIHSKTIFCAEKYITTYLTGFLFSLGFFFSRTTPGLTFFTTPLFPSYRDGKAHNQASKASQAFNFSSNLFGILPRDYYSDSFPSKKESITIFVLAPRVIG